MNNIFLSLNKKRVTNYVKQYINRTKSLKDIIEECNVSESVGVSLSDYIALYQTVRALKPKFVLECGTGKSTWIISQAMLDNCRETPTENVKLVSMDHNKEWADHAISILPDKFKDFVEILHSPMDTYGYSFIRGTVYKEVPDHPYEFVFVDGPSQGFDGEHTMCNMQFAKVVEKSDISVTAIIDNRKHTSLAYSLIFGPDKARFYTNWSLGFVDKVTRHDMLLHDKNIMKKTIFKSHVKLEHGNPF